MSTKRFLENIQILAVFLMFAVLLPACSTKSEGLAIGDDAPGFNMPTAQGGEVRLQDFSGSQPVLLFFHMAVG